MSGSSTIAPKTLGQLARSASGGKYSQQIDSAKRTYLSRSLGALDVGKAATGSNAHVETLLHNAKSIFKVTTNTVAMHLSEGWRDKLFKQIDSLLDADEWDDDDKPIASGSSLTFIRMILFLKTRRPGLGATGDGNLVASWTTGENRLTVICQPSDAVRWIVSVATEGGKETAAGQTTIIRLPEVLQPYNAPQWFSNEG